MLYQLAESKSSNILHNVLSFLSRIHTLYRKYVLGSFIQYVVLTQH
jgi:hypothetical protein